MSETMKAAVLDEFGGPEVLQYRDVPKPVPGPGELLVKVRAAGVQPADLAVRTGWTPPGAELRFPLVLGNEFAGVVTGLGDGASGFEVGAEVLGWGVLNSDAEYRVVPDTQVVAKPAGMAWEVAGAFNAAAQTADIALETLGVAAGETVLIHGAAGGVGTVATQLARLRGATVIGTASPGNHDYLRALGAIPVAYGPGLVDRVRAAAPGGVDAVLDGAGEEALLASLELVEDRSRIGTIVAFDLVDVLGVRWLTGPRSAQRLARVVEHHDRGELVVHVRATYPLAEIADAHRDVGTGHGRGKVVLVIG